jgi:predicted DNA-binding protein
MSTHRMNIDFPSEDYTYLKVLCAEKGVSIKDFVVPIILKAIEEEEDAFLIKKAERRFKNTKLEDLISIEEAMEQAGWNVK